MTVLARSVDAFPFSHFQRFFLKFKSQEMVRPLLFALFAAAIIASAAMRESAGVMPVK